MKKNFLLANAFAISMQIKFLLFVVVFSFGCLGVRGQTTITSGSTVNASTITAGNTVTINAGGTLNMDVSRSFASITTANSGTSTISGSGTLTVSGTNGVGIAPGNTLSLNTTCNTTILRTTTDGICTISGTGTLNASGNLVINKSNGSNTGRFDISSGTNVNVSQVERGTGNNGTWEIIINGFLGISGAAFNSGAISSITASIGSTINYNGSIAQTIYDILSPGYGNLTVTNNSTKTAGGGLDVRGNILINSTATFSASTLSHSIGGNWTNNGSFTAGTGTIAFNGTAAQTIGGSNATTFNNITINNSNGVTLNQPVSLNGIMTFTNGKVTSSSANSLTFNAGSSATGSSDASFVSGPVTKTGTTAFTFPVGNTTGNNPNRYHPISIGATGSTNTFVAQYFRTNPIVAVGGSRDAGIYGISVCEYWSLVQSSGTNTADVTIDWNQYSPCNGNAYITTTLGLILAWFDPVQTKWENSQGTAINYTNSGDYSSGTLERTSVTFSASPAVNYFTFGNVDENGSPLPVKLGPVTAFEKNNGVQINWTAYFEENLDKYVVERSADGSIFMPIGEVNANNITSESKYGFFDAKPLAGVSFYRLRNLDIDGKSGLSNIVRVNLGKTGADLRLYPNPTTNGTISYQSTDMPKGNYSIRIFNGAGQQVYNQRVAHQGGAISQTIQLPNSLLAGLYNLRMESETTIIGTKTFLVQ
jgi:hypothetical protein